MNPSLVDAADGAPFLKVTAGGNDFVLIDNRNGRLRGDPAGLVRAVCHRRLGVGADGLILIELSARADLKMVYFNRDGGQADLCANGLRCVARWAARTRSAPGRMRVETGAGVLEADGSADPPRVSVPLEGAPRALSLEVDNRRYDGILVPVGVPHLVIQSEDAFATGVLRDAPALRAHPGLGVGGANVDFFTPRGGSVLDVRTFERGVEAETLSSGTGSIATAVAADRAGLGDGSFVCRNREGMETRITLGKGADGGRTATLAAPVRFLYHGRFRREIFD
jgi:diaminopimelate epimerase